MVKELFRHIFVVNGRQFAVVLSADVEALERIFDVADDESANKNVEVVNKMLMGALGFVERVK